MTGRRRVLSLEKMLHVGLLFDFYGPLLTLRQRELVDLHYRQDLSLGEIATGMGVSRQAVFDLLRRATDALEEYEARLGMVSRFEASRVKLERLATLLEEMEGQVSERAAASLAEARWSVAQLLKEEV